MHEAIRRPWLMTSAWLALLAFASIPLRADIQKGVPRAQVVKEWGEPVGAFTSRGKEVLLYSGGRKVELHNGVVVLVIRNAPIKPVAARPATGVAASIPAPFVSIGTWGKDIPVVKIDWADSLYTTEMFRVAISRGKNLPPLSRIRGRSGKVDLQKALAAGGDVRAVDPMGRTALHEYATRTTSFSAVLDLIQMLVDHGAEVNAKDHFGQMPLHVAAQHDMRVLKLLLAGGANPNAKDEAGRTPLYLAVLAQKSGNRDVLIAAGADPATADSDGVTIADIAREQALWVARYEAHGKVKSLCFGRDRFLASGAFLGSVLISADGASWRAQAAPEKAGLSSIASIGNGFVGWGTGRSLYCSHDGVTWETAEASESPQQLGLTAVGPGRAIMMGHSATVMQSQDGRTWTGLKEGVAAYVLGVGWTGDRFLAVNKEGVVLCSLDGLTWGKVKLDLRGLALKRVRWVNGALVGVGYNGLMVRTRDGLEWEQIPIPTTDALNDIAWGDGTYVAVGDRGMVLLSEDGRKWRIRRIPDPGDFHAVTFGNHTFIAVNRNAIWSRHGE